MNRNALGSAPKADASCKLISIGCTAPTCWKHCAVRQPISSRQAEIRRRKLFTADKIKRRTQKKNARRSSSAGNIAQAQEPIVSATFQCAGQNLRLHALGGVGLPDRLVIANCI